MNEPFTPEPPQGHHTAITLFRVILWYLPSILVPIACFASEMITSNWFMAVIPIILIVSGIAYLERRLHLMQKRIAPPFNKAEFVVGMLLFAAAQIIMIPIVFVALVFGFILVSDFRI